MPAPKHEVPATPASSAYEEDAPASEFVPENPGAPLDDGAPVGPSEGEESSFLAEQRAQMPASAPATVAAEPEDRTPLPPLDDLVQRIPAATRDLMEELFRAKFVTVKRVPKSALKS